MEFYWSNEAFNAAAAVAAAASSRHAITFMTARARRFFPHLQFFIILDVISLSWKLFVVHNITIYYKNSRSVLVYCR